MKPIILICKSLPLTSFLAVTFSSVALLSATPSALPSGDDEIASFVELDVNLDQRDAGISIEVEMQDGVAILTGSAHSLGESERAAARAVSTAGVRSVVNAIQIKPASNSSLKRNIKQSLETQRMMDATQVAFTAYDGRVCLTGNVSTIGEKELARDLAASVDGVSWVSNEIQVSGGVPREDSRIAEHLKFLIGQDPAFQGLDLAVTVRSGSVGLSGQVGSGEEIGRLMRLCRVEGVSGFRTSALSVNEDLAMEAFEEKNYGREQAESALAAALEKDTRVQADSIRFKLDDKRMILSGYVGDLAASEAAESDARAIPGVVMVSNELDVRSEDFSQIKAASPPLIRRPR